MPAQQGMVAVAHQDDDGRVEPRKEFGATFTAGAVQAVPGQARHGRCPADAAVQVTRPPDQQRAGARQHGRFRGRQLREQRAQLLELGAGGPVSGLRRSARPVRNAHPDTSPAAPAVRDRRCAPAGACHRERQLRLGCTAPYQVASTTGQHEPGARLGQRPLAQSASTRVSDRRSNQAPEKGFWLRSASSGHRLHGPILSAGRRRTPKCWRATGVVESPNSRRTRRCRVARDPSFRRTQAATGGAQSQRVDHQQRPTVLTSPELQFARARSAFTSNTACSKPMAGVCTTVAIPFIRLAQRRRARRRRTIAGARVDRRAAARTGRPDSTGPPARWPRCAAGRCA